MTTMYAKVPGVASTASHDMSEDSNDRRNVQGLETMDSLQREMTRKSKMADLTKTRLRKVNEVKAGTPASAFPSSPTAATGIQNIVASQRKLSEEPHPRGSWT